MERLTERRNVIDILEKFQFFQGQRAGRELWNDKPKNVQEEDLENFNRDIRTIRDYIWDLEHELKLYKDAEEQGLLLRLPYPLGTKKLYWACEYDCEIYTLDALNLSPRKNDISGTTIYIIDDYEFGEDDFGKILFLTKEEAEQALAKMDGKEEGGE